MTLWAYSCHGRLQKCDWELVYFIIWWLLLPQHNACHQLCKRMTSWRWGLFIGVLAFSFLANYQKIKLAAVHYIFHIFPMLTAISKLKFNRSSVTNTAGMVYVSFLFKYAFSKNLHIIYRCFIVLLSDPFGCISATTQGKEIEVHKRPTYQQGCADWRTKSWVINVADG